jgi:two-component system OmpR family sensor kinase
MRSTAQLIARHPRGWPLRWRLAAVSAGLTLAILVLFAVVIGGLTQDRIRDDFEQELETAAGQIATEIEIASATGGLRVSPSDLEKMSMADAAAVRIVGPEGQIELASPGDLWLGPSSQASAPGDLALGPPAQEVQTVGDLSVATAPVVTSGIGEGRFVQYARNNAELDATIERLWLFLAAGVIAGTGLAALAGFLVAGRAMRPISDLTATAREIASTRDPSRRVPQPDTDDEVAELARTLDEMLQSLDAARAEREAMMQAQRDFIADASHELRTPLTSVLANLELLEASLARRATTAETEEEAQTVRSAIRSARRMSRLVSDLLLLARADAGRTAPRRDVDLAELARAAVEEVRPTAGGREIAVDTPEPVVVSGNPDELHRMVANLVDNAVRHTPERTRIEVRTGTRDGRARLVISDDGPGLPPGVERHIFERFSRGSGPADRATAGGTGLGLAIVRAVANSHGGEVSAGGSEAGGARFEVALPLRGSFAAEPPRVETHS